MGILIQQGRGYTGAELARHRAEVGIREIMTAGDFKGVEYLRSEEPVFANRKEGETTSTITSRK